MLSLLLSIGLVQAYVAYNQIKEIPETMSVTDPLYLYKPFVFSVAFECTGHPAVNSEGEVSTGMPGKKWSAKQCRHDSQGQMYVRKMKYARKTAFAYCIYVPQSIPLNGPGHTHDWACVVLWFYKGVLDDVFSNRYGQIPRDNWFILYGNHLKFWATQPDSFSNKPWRGTYLQPTEHREGPAQDHLPLVNYDELPKKARAALEAEPFMGRPCPLRDNGSEIINLLGNAYSEPTPTQADTPLPTVQP